MSKPMADTPKRRRPRRQFTDEFKASAVRLVLDEGKSVGAAARDLDLTETALREWVKRAQADRTKGRTGLTTAEREELVRLRKALRIAEDARHLKKCMVCSSVARRHPSDGGNRLRQCIRPTGGAAAPGLDGIRAHRSS